MSVKIRSLEMENVKRVKAVTLIPAENGLTVIGGDNMQGKTTVLDAICFALGGEKFRPSNLKREGAVAEAYIKLELTNGLIAERKGKNSELKVTDPTGKKGGQKLLDSFIEELALNLPEFINASSKEKGKILLQIIGVGDQLAKLDDKEQRLFNERHGIGVVADRKAKFAEEMASYPDVPELPITAGELMERQKAIMSRNIENDNIRKNLKHIEQELDLAIRNRTQAQTNVSELERKLTAAKQEAKDKEKIVSDFQRQVEQAKEKTANLQDESTEQLEKELAEVEATNSKVRANNDKAKAVEDAEAMKKEYETLSASIESVRQQRISLLDGAKMPLPGLSIEAGELTLDGKKWDCMSGSQQLQAATAIVRELKPQCGFVLLDGLEQMDIKTLSEFGTWLEECGLQAIATRVSRGGECSIVIEDGMVYEKENKPVFVPGEF